MNAELKHLIELVKASKEPVQVVVEGYFDSVIWTCLKDEYEDMSDREKAFLFQRLQHERTKR